MVPSMPSAVFSSVGSLTTKENLKEITNRVKQVTTYVLSSVLQEGYLGGAVNVLLSNQPPAAGDQFLELLRSLVHVASGFDSTRESRILYVLLQHVMVETTKQESEQFLLLARKIEAKG